MRVAALLLGVLAGAPAHAGTVAVLRSSGAAPYVATASAFRAAWHGPVVELSLDAADSGTVARRLAALRPDAVIGIGLRASLAARDALPRTPLVYCMVPDPARWPLEGPWITGVAADVPARALFDALREVAPDVRRLAFLHGPSDVTKLVREARASAPAAGLVLVDAPVAGLAALPAAARALAGRADALWLPADPEVATPETFQFLLELSLQRRTPLLVFSEGLVQAGALLAVVPDCDWTGAAAAAQLRRIEAGERAADVPVAPLGRTRTVFNAQTARALGRNIPPARLRVVEVVP